VPPKHDPEALVRAAEALRAAPGDLAALATVAAELRLAGKKSDAAKAFDALSRAAREDGHIAIAIYAAHATAEQGDRARQAALLKTIAQAYGAGSARIDKALRARPPAPKAAPTAAAAGGKVDGVKLAAEAVAAAGKHADELAAKNGKLPAAQLVASIAPAPLEQLLGGMKLSTREKDNVVVDVGEEANALFLVARGALAVTRGAHELGRLRAGAFFGEIALLGGTRRTAKVTFDEDVWLLEIPRAAIEAAAAKAPGLADTLAAYARSRLLANTMRTSEIFRRLTPEDRDQLVGRFVPRVLETGAVMIQSGQTADRLHVVVSGDVEIRRGGAAVAKLGAGDVFGEMGLLARKPASADAVAMGRTVTLSLDRASFDDVAVKHPAVLAEVYKLLLAREQANAAKGGDEDEVITDADEEIVL
jgi:CRP-like cAMP-binding protein